MPLLTREQEAHLFRKYNYLKYKTAKLREQLDPAQPKSSLMDEIEQLQQKMIRPVIAPDPKIVPKSSDDATIPDLVARVHRRLTQDDPFRAQ